MKIDGQGPAYQAHASLSLHRDVVDYNQQMLEMMRFAAEMRISTKGAMTEQIVQSLIRVGRSEHPRYSWEVARSAAMNETVILEWMYEGLRVTPLFAPLHRLWRTIELSQDTTSAGDTLFVGANYAALELTGFKIRPPFPKDIRTFYDTEDLSRSHEVNFPNADGYTRGRSVAVDPAEIDQDSFDRLLSLSGYPRQNLQFVPLTIGEALDRGEVPRDLKHIVWHRCDPKIFSDGFKDVTDEKDQLSVEADVKKQLARLRSYLGPKSDLLLTVGTGNDAINSAEYDWRINLVKIIVNVLKANNFGTSNILSMNVSRELGDKYDHLLFGGRLGIEAFVYAQFK